LKLDGKTIGVDYAKSARKYVPCEPAVGFLLVYEALAYDSTTSLF
jgi:hypothetical protein